MPCRQELIILQGFKQETLALSYSGVNIDWEQVSNGVTSRTITAARRQHMRAHLCGHWTVCNDCHLNLKRNANARTPDDVIVLTTHDVTSEGEKNNYLAKLIQLHAGHLTRYCYRVTCGGGGGGGTPLNPPIPLLTETESTTHPDPRGSSQLISHDVILKVEPFYDIFPSRK
ncbi:hypothetical protein J6590_061069 [Homalodisca vitripennis]|nr:hypothetical protein J6590_061069 [Homalodisca vitripennis]